MELECGGQSIELCLEYSVLGIYLYWVQKPINPRISNSDVVIAL
jgi:hypothetical protein